MILQTRRKLGENYFRNEEASLLLTPPAKSDWIMSPQRLTSGTKNNDFWLQKAVFTCFNIRFVQFLVKDKDTALSHMRFYLFPFCQRLSSNLSWCQHRIGLLLKIWYFVVSTPYGLNQLLGIQTKPKCSNKIEKVENAKPFLLRDVCVLLIFIANKKAESQIAKVGPRLQIKTFPFSSFTARSIFWPIKIWSADQSCFWRQGSCFRIKLCEILLLWLRWWEIKHENTTISFYVGLIFLSEFTFHLV